MSLTLHFDRKSEANSISVNLTVELSPCHPGFVYDATSQRCECYDANDIVLCSGSTSSSKEGTGMELLMENQPWHTVQSTIVILPAVKLPMDITIFHQ